MSFLSRRFLLIFMCFWPGLAASAEQLSLSEISAYLNGLTTLKTEFRQYNDDGSVSTGTLYIRRPGRMRFEYDPPEQALVIASASAVYIIDRKSNQLPETYPLSRTPLSLILGRSIDLTRANMVQQSRFDGAATIVTASDPDNPDTGSIELTFTDSPTQLREWVIFDATGGRTKVELGAFETGIELPGSLFSPDLERNKDR